MADLGPIQLVVATFPRRVVKDPALLNIGTISTVRVSTHHVGRTLPAEFCFDARVVVNIDNSATISGTVTDGITPVPGCEVWLFHRASKQAVRRGITDANGLFTFTNLYRYGAQAYFAVALPKDGMNYNALIFDKVTPT